jgi:K+-sensing histidine kinase KdpD
MYVEAVRALLSTIVSILSGLMVAFAYRFLFQVPNPTVPNWYEQPVIIAAGASIATIIIGKILDRYMKRMEREDDREDENDARILALSEKKAELTQQEWVELLNRRDRLHEREITYLQNAHITIKIDLFRSRGEKHRALNEITRLHGYIREMEKAFIRIGHETPHFNLKYYEEMMEGLDDLVVKYQESLEQVKL